MKNKIDKSALMFGEQRRIRDPKYLRSYKDKVCEASDRGGHEICGQPCVGAHIRIGEYSGTGNKPSDDLTIGLCDAHHREQENGGYEWLVEHILKPQLRRRYRNERNI